MNGNLLQKTPIAIIGQAAIFAKASTLTEYWDNILNKIDGITDVPPFVGIRPIITILIQKRKIKLTAKLGDLSPILILIPSNLVFHQIFLK